MSEREQPDPDSDLGVSERARGLYKQGYTSVNLSHFSHGTAASIIFLLQSLYGDSCEFLDFDEAAGDAEHAYFQKGGEQLYICSVYYRLKSSAKDFIVTSIDFSNTSFPEAQLTKSRTQGQRTLVVGNLILDPFMKRADKERTTDFIVEQLYNLLDIEPEHKKQFLDATFAASRGYQLCCATALYNDYAEQIEKLFHKNKIRDLENHVLQLFSELETKELHDATDARQAADHKRKMMVQFKEEILEDDFAKTKVLVENAARAAEKSCRSYSGPSKFDKPKKLKCHVDINVTLKTKPSKFQGGANWTYAFFMFTCSNIAKAPAIALKWALPGYPKAVLLKAKTPSELKAAKVNFPSANQSSWSKAYDEGGTKVDKLKGLRSKGKQAGAPSKKGNKKKKQKEVPSESESFAGQVRQDISDFGEAAGEGSSSAASSSSGSSSSATTAERNIMARLQEMERQVQLTVTQSQCKQIAIAEVAKGFKAFQKIMETLAAEISELTSSLLQRGQDALETAEDLEKSVATQEVIDSIKNRYEDVDLTDEQLDKIVAKAIEQMQLAAKARAEDHRQFAKNYQSTSASIVKCFSGVDNKVKQLAASVQVEYSTPTPATLPPSKKRKALESVKQTLDMNLPAAKKGSAYAATFQEGQSVGLVSPEASAVDQEQTRAVDQEQTEAQVDATH